MPRIMPVTGLCLGIVGHTLPREDLLTHCKGATLPADRYGWPLAHPTKALHYRGLIAREGVLEKFTLRGRTAIYRYYCAPDGYKSLDHRHDPQPSQTWMSGLTGCCGASHLARLSASHSRTRWPSTK